MTDQRVSPGARDWRNLEGKGFSARPTMGQRIPYNTLPSESNEFFMKAEIGLFC